MPVWPGYGGSGKWIEVGRKSFSVSVEQAGPGPSVVPAQRKGISFWEIAAALGFSLLLLSAARGD